MTVPQPLTALRPGMEILVGGSQVVTVDEKLAEAFRPGDQLRFLEETGALLHIPAAEQRLVTDVVGRSLEAFRAMGSVTDAQIDDFYARFAASLADDAVWQRIAEQNEKDVESARSRGRSVTRLIATEKMRAAMIEGLRVWVGSASNRGKIVDTVEHDGWRAELVGAALGIVAFVFEGRPNVVADATGVLRSGNVVVFRIGRDALETARAILREALTPALEAAGLPRDAVALVDSTSHASGWALFSERRVSLAVARGSGPAVATLGGLAQSVGVPVSLHGTGGAWMITGREADARHLEDAIVKSLDRKVCNTLNVLCILRERAQDLLPAALEGFRRAGERRNQPFQLHVVEGDEGLLPAQLREATVQVQRADGVHPEPQVCSLQRTQLGTEWEWEETPEISLCFVDSVAEAVSLFNAHSPQFVVSLISENAEEHSSVFLQANAPFVGDGMTRWVDGQYALKRPELGLSNWHHGRLLGRGAILTGDSVFTLRTRAVGHRIGFPKDR